MDMAFNMVLKTRSVNEGISKSSIGYSIHNLPVYAALSLAVYLSGIIGLSFIQVKTNYGVYYE